MCFDDAHRPPVVWCARLDAFRRRAETLRLARPVGGDGSPWELSVVHHRDKVSLVQWSYAKMKRGRLVSIDSNRRAIWPTAGSSSEIDFSTGVIVHPAIGLILRRSKDRDPVPPHILRLMNCWKLCTAPFADQTHVLSPECVVCGLGDSQHAVVECAVCQLQWHSQCCRRALEIQVLQPVALGIDWLPGVLSADAVCLLCAAWLRLDADSRSDVLPCSKSVS
jgi:hypothetical protein